MCVGISVSRLQTGQAFNACRRYTESGYLREIDRIFMPDPRPVSAAVCPFCLSPQVGLLSGAGKWHVHCRHCGASGPAADTDLDALARWSNASDSRQLLRTVMDESPSVILLKDIRGRFLLANQAAASLYDTTPENMLGKTDADFISDSGQLRTFRESQLAVMKSGRTEVVEEDVTDAVSGETRRFYSVKKALRLGAHAEPVMLIIARDITDLKQAYHEIEVREQRYAEALAIAGEGIWDWNISTNIVSHNRKWCELMGLNENALQHPLEFFSALIHPDDLDGVMHSLQGCLDGGAPYDHEHRLIHADGHIIWVHDRGNLVERDEQGLPLRMVGSLSDITARKCAELQLAKVRRELERANAQLEDMVEQRTAELVDLNLELQSLARHDPLTGLANRLAADEYLTREFAMMKRTGQPYVVMLADIDHFKQVNDTYGHITGDQALKHIASLFRENLRETDFIARFGGEEFLLILGFSRCEDALRLAEVTPLGGDIPMTISIGMAQALPDDSGMAAAVERADEQLYLAKGSGRNRVCCPCE